MTTTLITAPAVPRTGRTAKIRQARARLAPGGRDRGQDRPPGRDTRSARHGPAGEAAHWRRVLDLLDPDRRCGEWSPVRFAGRPVVCTRAPHDKREQHSDAATGWRWYSEDSA